MPTRARDTRVSSTERKEGDKVFDSSWLKMCLNGGGVGACVFLVVVLLFGWEVWSYGAGFGLLAFGYYFSRFLIKTPKRIYVTTEGIRIWKRHGEKIFLPWKELTHASLTGRARDVWRLVGRDGAVLFTDDGFSTVQWESLSEEIKTHLETWKIPFEEGGRGGGKNPS